MHERHQTILEILKTLQSDLESGRSAEARSNCETAINILNNVLESKDSEKICLRFLSKSEVSERVGYCGVHIMRLANANKFPKPIKLGPGRVAFVENEVVEWQLDRIAERDRAPAARKRISENGSDEMLGRVPETNLRGAGQ